MSPSSLENLLDLYFLREYIRLSNPTRIFQINFRKLHSEMEKFPKLASRNGIYLILLTDQIQFSQ